MDTETILARNLRKNLSLEAAWDSACKAVLANTRIIAWILVSCTDEFAGCSIEEVMENYIEDGKSLELIHGSAQEDSSVEDGVVYLDITFYARLPGSHERIGLVINLEVQSDYYPGYVLVKRGIYYGSRKIVFQKGRIFLNSHYENMIKVYSIWIALQPPQYRQNTINSYFMAEKSLVGNYHEKKEDYDMMNIMILNLGNVKESDGILKLLNVLLLDQNLTRKKRILEEEYGIPMTRELEKGERMMMGIGRMFIEQGLNEGINQERESWIQRIQNLMIVLNYSLEESLALLNVPQDEWEYYQRKMTENPK